MLRLKGTTFFTVVCLSVSLAKIILEINNEAYCWLSSLANIFHHFKVTQIWANRKLLSLKMIKFFESLHARNNYVTWHTYRSKWLQWQQRSESQAVSSLIIVYSELKSATKLHKYTWKSQFAVDANGSKEGDDLSFCELEDIVHVLVFAIWF